MSVVRVFKEEQSGLYGFEYTIDAFCTLPMEVLEKMNTACDTIIYREHHKALNGEYPDVKEISFFPHSHEHSIVMDKCSLEEVSETAKKIAAALNCSYAPLAQKGIVRTTFGNIGRKILSICNFFNM